MAFKPDYGLRLEKDGIGRNVNHCFYRVPLHGFDVTGLGHFTICLDVPYEGETHALSLDFGNENLTEILSLVSPDVRQDISLELARDPNRPRSIHFPSPVYCDHICASLGDIQHGPYESYIPLNIIEVGVSSGSRAQATTGMPSSVSSEGVHGAWEHGTDENDLISMFRPPTEDELSAGLALVPQHIRDSLPRTGRCSDNVRRIKLHAPWNQGAYAGWCWYVISVDETDDNLAYCYVEGLANENGEVRLDRIASIRGPRGLRVVRAEGYSHGSSEPLSEVPRSSPEAEMPHRKSTDLGRNTLRHFATQCENKQMNDQPNARERLVQMFKFLRALADLRTPDQRNMDDYSDVMRLDSWPAHPCIFVRRGDPSGEDEPDENTNDLDPVIRITRASLTPCPQPPRLLEKWLVPGWEAVNTEVEVVQARNFRDNLNRATVTVGFYDDPDRVRSLERWKAIRAKWVEAERPAVSARQLFEDAYALWAKMQREGDRQEMVVADGMLCVEDHLVKHPVLLQRISLDFDPSVPEFRFVSGMEKPELQRALLRLVPTIEGTMIARFDQELEAEPVEPLGGAATEGFFRRLVQGLFKDGEFLDGKPQIRGAMPCLWREPVIITRPRTSGLSTTLDRVIEDLDDEATEVPEGLSRIVGIDVDASGAGASDLGGSTSKATLLQESDILFSKPANAEQREIAVRLRRAKSVVVQGPPGTGKTHTIANLLGHLLSEGKTVLVTAHTTKALRVLRKQIEKPLQPLCLSVLESDTKSQDQLSHAAKEIAHRLSHSDPEALRREAVALRAQRSKLLKDGETLQQRIREARFSEIEEIVLGGDALSPVEVAKRVAARSAQDSWIPGPLNEGVLCPLADSEVRELYASQGALSPADEKQLATTQPELAGLVSSVDFRLLAAEHAGAASRAQTHCPEFWNKTEADCCTAAELRQIQLEIQSAALALSEEQRWLREVLFAGWTGGELRKTWHDLLVAMETLSQRAAVATRLEVEHGPELPPDSLAEDVLPILSEIIGFIEGGGRLGFNTWITRYKWHRLADACKVHGRVPRTVDELRALSEAARLDLARKHFVERWHRLVERCGGPSIDAIEGSPERIATGYAPEIRKRLEWRDRTWEPLIEKFNKIGFHWTKWLDGIPPEPADHGELARLRNAIADGLNVVIGGQVAKLRQAELANELLGQRTYLAEFPKSEAVKALQRAQAEWDVEAYDQAYEALSSLQELKEVYAERLAMLDRLKAAAPNWARAIANRSELHATSEPPGDHARAWQWRQWHQELENRASASIDEFQDRYQEVASAALQLSSRIIDCETWAAQCDRTGLEQQQALMGFVQTIKKVGKGTGKRAPRLLHQARELLSSARRAVPAWIMPLSRVYGSFDPRETKFDVVIIDEASQSDVTSLAALYLGNSHIVVGDKEQVTPDAVGQRVGDVDRLIEIDLQGIPNRHLYDGQTSVYDLAEAAFGGVVALREHFRCVPEIIQFCNQLSYNNSIRPLREPLSASVRPPLVPQRVKGYRNLGGKENEVEAEEIASLVAACLDDPAYAENESGASTSFGVISLLGNEQAYLIESKLRKHLGPEIFARHRLLCGNAAQFQGDERDVIFLSMVDGPPEDGKLSFRDAGPNGLYKKRYNVAVSRARNQLWVIHSLDPESHLKSRDLRRQLIEHARDPDALMRTTASKSEQTESKFEKLVLERLLIAGYRVQPQWPVGAYRIDLVVEGKDRRLAVECDGDRWHTAEQLENDLERQAILQRLGWVFTRIRGSLFYRDPDAAMRAVFAKLDHLGIEPLGEVSDRRTGGEEVPVIDRLRRRAEDLRRDWAEDLRGAQVRKTALDGSEL